MFLDLQELIDAINQASIETAPRRPESQIIERPGWHQVITPLIKSPKFNGVTYSVLSENEVDRQIAQTFELYRKLELPFHWEVGPKCTPSDLAARLQSSGMKLASEVFGLVADPQRLELEQRAEIQIERVTQLNAPGWILASTEGWQDLPKDLRSVYFLEDLHRDLEGKRHLVCHFVAYYEGKLAGAASLRFVNQTGYLHGSSVRPEFRRKGVYTSLVAHRVRILKELGIPAAIVQCLKETSAPILQQLGFEKICNIQVYYSESEL